METIANGANNTLEITVSFNEYDVNTKNIK